jgi:uncharacterized protein
VEQIVPKSKLSIVRVATTVVLIVTGLYVVCVVGLTLAQRRLMYFPCRSSMRQLRMAASAQNFREWRDGRGKFQGWAREQQDSKGRRILLLHGNAGCAPDWTHYADAFQARASADFYILEYPGYGGRPGKHTQKEILEAAEEGFESIAHCGKIYLLGESLGTGVASYLAGKYPDRVAGVFLVAPYESITAVARRHLPLFPVKLMLKDTYPASAWLKAYKGPLAVLLAGKDRVIPNDLGRKLYDDYAGPKKLWLEPGAGHNDVHHPRPALIDEVVEFWDNAER